MDGKTFVVKLEASAYSLDLLVKMFEDLVAELTEIEDKATNSRGIQLPMPLELEGDWEYIRGTLSHEAVEDVPLGLADDSLRENYRRVRQVVSTHYLSTRQRVRSPRSGTLARRQLTQASAADLALKNMGRALGIVEEDSPEPEKLAL